MGCCGSRDKGPPEQHARWEYLNLSDFKANSAWTGFAYGWLWFMVFVSLAVYGVDTFTAVNLLAFNQWSSQVQPSVPFEYSKWIFAGCILLSWVLLFFEWIRAIRVIRRGGVAESYMDPIAATFQSCRPKGFKRFLVFTELTKSRKGADYVAFFTYFNFKSAVRIIVAEGPRIAINAITLYSVMQAQLLPHDSNRNNFEQFWINVGELANRNTQQAVILFSMLFTLVIWVFSALSLIASVILYLSFLWHYIPSCDGRLSIYCRRKVDKRLERIVEKRVQAGIEEENRKRLKAERKAEERAQKTGELILPQMGITKRPTLPNLESTEKKDEKPTALFRHDTGSSQSTLPLYTSRPSSGTAIQRQPTLPDLPEHPGMPPRTFTQQSNLSQVSFDGDAPLLPNAGYAGGQERGPSPAPIHHSRHTPQPQTRPDMGPGVAPSLRSAPSMPRMESRAPPSYRGLDLNYDPFIDQRSMIPTHHAMAGPGGPYANRSFTAPATIVPFHGSSPAQQLASGPSTPHGGPQAMVQPIDVPQLARVPQYDGTQRSGIPLRKPPPAAVNFNRPFQSPSNESLRSQARETYEMTSNPSLRSSPVQGATDSYVAFTPVEPTASTHTSHDYFGPRLQGHGQRSATAPIRTNDADAVIVDIINEYGARGEPNRQNQSGRGPTGGQFPRYQ